MKKHERNIQILLSALKTNNKMSLHEAIELLGVSESTVRRLFSSLEEQGEIVRVYGGIQLTNSFLEYSYDKVSSENVEQKTSIAKFAAEMIENNDVIYMDSGSTIASLSAEIAHRVDSGELLRIKVFTNSLINLTQLNKSIDKSQISINLIGGEYRSHRHDFCGYLAEENVKSLRFNKCFLGTDGYNRETGFTTTDFLTARINELALMHSDKSIVLADSSKFKTSAMVSYTRNAKVDAVITDHSADKNAIKELEKNKIKVYFSKS